MSLFITFEGIEGVGKSTQLKFVERLLQTEGVPAMTTREPGGTQMGEEIRDILLKHRHEMVDPIAELLLLLAARIQHVERVIRPALQQGQWVLCDRFMDATYAYQGGGRGVSLDIIEPLEKLTLKALKPDLTFLLDAPLEIAFQRIRDRGGHPDRFELEKQAFFEKIRYHYCLRAKQDPKRFAMIDASLPLGEVQQAVAKVIQEFLKRQLT